MRYILIFAALVLPIAAYAQSPIYPVGAPSGYGSKPQAVTVGGSSAAAIVAGNYSNASFLNQSASVTVYCIWGATATNAATAGQYTFSPLSGYIWDSSDPPPKNTALNCIGASSAPVTVRAY